MTGCHVTLLQRQCLRQYFCGESFDWEICALFRKRVHLRLRRYD